jgi:hypothetical protein
VFDEAHKAKNLYQDPPTATGKLVLALQDRLPNARVYTLTLSFTLILTFTF